VTRDSEGEQEMQGVEISAVGQISVTVQDVDRAAAFYEQVLGLRLLFRFPGMAFFDVGGVRLYLAKAETPDFDRTSILYYRVDDVRGAAAALEARGVTMLHPPRIAHRDERHVLWLAFFLDSEGNRFAVMAEAPPDA
jgi:methylmalonyl-CoA/ethylmalonyl-CoA epimerase